MTDQQISIDFTVIRGRDKKVQGGSSHFSAPSLLAHFPHRPSERNGMVTLLCNPLQTSSLEVRNSVVVDKAQGTEMHFLLGRLRKIMTCR